MAALLKIGTDGTEETHGDQSLINQKRDASSFKDRSENGGDGKCPDFGFIWKVKGRVKVKYKRKRKVKNDSKILGLVSIVGGGNGGIRTFT